MFAWKQLKPGVDNSARLRFQREIEIISKLNHPQIIEVVFADLLAPDPYFVMPKAKQNLDVAIKFDVNNRLDKNDLFKQICEGVIYAHGTGVYHRDLKPKNVLLTESGAVKICDFGIARDIQSDLEKITKLNDIGGTHPYTAPEQFDSSLKDIDQRADVFSLGKILYYIYSGREPYLISEDHVPYKVYEFVKKATDSDRNKRFPSIKLQLEEFLKSVVGAPKPSVASPQPQAKRFSEVQIEVQKLAKSAKGRVFFSDRELEKIVRELHKIMWLNRDLLGLGSSSDKPLKMLEATQMLQIMGFKVTKSSNLGNLQVGGHQYQVAGQIDQRAKTVVISSQFDAQTTRFTEAHELGHAFLHLQEVMHRDRPLNGYTSAEKATDEEYQANKFAAFFLMPRYQVIEKFRAIFGVEKIGVNQQTAEALFRINESVLIKYAKSLTGYCRLIAEVTQVGSRPVHSMAEIFRVSTEAMAIRLEELDLVEFP
jgi:Zn-dependent peptidase ImmA (M78 family)